MSDQIVIIEDVRELAIIEDGGETFVVHDVDQVVEVVMAIEQGMPGPPGGGLAAVQDDPAPELGGDLTLNTFNINGQLENTGLIIDGGLL